MLTKLTQIQNKQIESNIDNMLNKGFRIPRSGKHAKGYYETHRKRSKRPGRHAK